MVKLEAFDAFLYECATWTLLKCDFEKLRTVGYRMLLGIRWAWFRYHFTLSYDLALQQASCGSVESAVRTKRLLLAGALIPMDGYRLS